MSTPLVKTGQPYIHYKKRRPTLSHTRTPSSDSSAVWPQRTVKSLVRPSIGCCQCRCRAAGLFRVLVVEREGESGTCLLADGPGPGPHPSPQHSLLPALLGGAALVHTRKQVGLLVNRYVV